MSDRDPVPAQDRHSPVADQLVGRNRSYATKRFPEVDVDRPVEPKLRLAVVTCMDARIDPLPILGLDNGDAHVIRNAGGVVTDDVIRSLCLSQRALGTREIILFHHTDCGLQKVVEAEFRQELQAEFGVTPPWSVESFDDPRSDVSQSMARLRLSPFVANDDSIRGFVYDVTTGLLEEVRQLGRSA